MELNKIIKCKSARDLKLDSTLFLSSMIHSVINLIFDSFCVLRRKYGETSSHERRHCLEQTKNSLKEDKDTHSGSKSWKVVLNGWRWWPQFKEEMEAKEVTNAYLVSL